MSLANPILKSKCRTSGDYMKYARESRGFTMKHLSEKSGISTAAIGAWENNKRDPSLFNVIAVCEVLGTSVEEYTGWNEIRGRRYGGG